MRGGKFYYSAHVGSVHCLKPEQYCDYRVETQGDGDPLGQKYYDAFIDDLDRLAWDGEGDSLVVRPKVSTPDGLTLPRRRADQAGE